MNNICTCRTFADCIDNCFYVIFRTIAAITLRSSGIVGSQNSCDPFGCADAIDATYIEVKEETDLSLFLFKVLLPVEPMTLNESVTPSPSLKKVKYWTSFFVTLRVIHLATRPYWLSILPVTSITAPMPVPL